MIQAIFDLELNDTINLASENKSGRKQSVHNLSAAEIDKEYIIQNVITDDREVENFLFTLGCFKGEAVTVISVLSENLIISIKDARYSIDVDLAKAIKLF